MLTPQELVQREVQACASYLVATLANRPDDGPRLRSAAGNDLADLCWQAIELACPVDDWEEAAIQNGWLQHEGRWLGYDHDSFASPEAALLAGECGNHETAQEACEANDIEPYQREVYEHWFVSEWLAEKLEAEGEKVDKDFAGLCVWARTTTGQAIYADGVIERICAKLNEAV